MVCLVFAIATSLPVHQLSLAMEGPGASDPPARVEKEIQVILSAKNPYGAVEGYRKLFKKVGPNGLRALHLHAHDGIAIQTAWEEVKLTVPSLPPTRPVRPDRHRLDWFLGFLEGRARVQAPQWWAEALLDSWANGRDNINPGDPKESPYHKAGWGFARAPHGTTLRREGENFVLSVGKESIHIPEELLQKSDRGYRVDNVSALMASASRCHIAVHDGVGYPYQLACIDRSSARVLWKSEVWATCWGASSGQHEMWVAITEQNKRVMVFGSASSGVHVEAFRAEDGVNLFRFSSRY